MTAVRMQTEPAAGMDASREHRSSPGAATRDRRRLTAGSPVSSCRIDCERKNTARPIHTAKYTQTRTMKNGLLSHADLPASTAS